MVEFEWDDNAFVESVAGVLTDYDEAIGTLLVLNGQEQMSYEDIVGEFSREGMATDRLPAVCTRLVEVGLLAVPTPDSYLLAERGKEISDKILRAIERAKDKGDL